MLITLNPIVKDAKTIKKEKSFIIWTVFVFGEESTNSDCDTEISGLISSTFLFKAVPFDNKFKYLLFSHFS